MIMFSRRRAGRDVLILNQYALPRGQAGGTRHVDIFGRLSRWNFTILAGDRNHYTQQKYQTEDRRFRLIHVPRHESNGVNRIWGWLVFGIKVFMRSVLTRRCDVIYASTPHLLVPLAGLFAAKLTRRAFVLEVRDLWPDTLVDAGAVKRGSVLHWILASLERALARSADHIVALVPGWDEHFLGMGVRRERISIITNGADVADFRATSSRGDMRRQLGLHDFTAIYAGAHGPANRLEYILEAAAQLPNVTFVLVGDGSEKTSLMRSAEQLENVRFLDPVSKEDLPDLLAACDVGLHCIAPLPVLQKGMSPNKLFDYLAAGLPVVSNAGEALRAVVEDGEVGRLVQEDGFAEAIADVMSASPEEVRAWVARGQDLLTREYSRDSAAQKMQAVLDSLRKRK